MMGFIFDMDGTLLDSLSVWADSDREFLEGLGCEYDPRCSAAMKTMYFDTACQYLADEFSLPMSAEEVGRRIFEIAEKRYLNDIELKPGAEQFLRKAKERGIKMCVATSNIRALAEGALRNRGVLGYMEFVLTSDEVGCGKESPEIFLRAAERLGTAPEDTVVFEDSLHAVKSAKEAGFTVVGLYNPVCEEEFSEIKKLADLTAESFYELVISESGRPIDRRPEGHDELRGAVLVRRKFESRPDWDHEHCELCMEKISGHPGIQSEGYCTVDGQRWICAECFGAFKDTFGWVLG